MIYLQDVLGLHGVVLPREIPVLFSPAEVQYQEARHEEVRGGASDSNQSFASPASSPNSAKSATAMRTPPKAEFRTTGDLASSALVCLLWASSGEPWPLEGAAGELARKMVQAMKLGEADVFWIEWKSTPAQRAPDAVLELVASAGFRPAIGFGLPAITSVTGAVATLGQWQDWQGVQLMPTHALPELMKQPGLKKPAWTHLQLVMKVL